MSGSRLLIGVASVLAGTTVLLSVFGFVYNPILLVAAVPFAAATYLLFSHGTGRLEARMRERARSRPVDVGAGPSGGNGDRAPGGARRRESRGRATSWQQRQRATWSRQSPRTDGDSTVDPSTAARILGVDPDADDAAIRRAFREKAKELHPDASGGDEAEFRRARAAYERLSGRQ